MIPLWDPPVGTEKPLVFSGSLTLLSPLCFYCCQEGSVIKLPFLSWLLCLTVSAVGRLVCSCCGGGLLWAHRRLFYVGLQEGQIQNQWGNSSDALNSIFARQDPLRGVGISGTPNGRIVDMTDRGNRRDEGDRKLLLVWNVKRAGSEGFFGFLYFRMNLILCNQNMFQLSNKAFRAKSLLNKKGTNKYKSSKNTRKYF